MSEAKKSFDELFENLKEYLQTKLDIFSLTFSEKLSNILSTLILKSFFLIFFSIGLFFGSIALALYIGQLTNNTMLGFLIVGGGFMAIAMCFLFVSEQWLRKIFFKIFINQFYQEKP